MTITTAIEPTFMTPTALADLAAKLVRTGPSAGGTIYASDVAYLLARKDLAFITPAVVRAAEAWLADWEKATEEMRTDRAYYGEFDPYGLNRRGR